MMRVQQRQAPHSLQLHTSNNNRICTEAWRTIRTDTSEDFIVNLLIQEITIQHAATLDAARPQRALPTPRRFQRR